jgi:hypothetical protein
MHTVKSYSEFVGDGIVQKLEIDFEQKSTLLLLHRWSDGELEIVAVRFEQVLLQHFEGASDSNVVFDLEESQDKGLFRHQWGEYLKRQEKYLSSEVLLRITNDPAARIFYLTASCGLEGFIICIGFELSPQA